MKPVPQSAQAFTQLEDELDGIFGPSTRPEQVATADDGFPEFANEGVRGSVNTSDTAAASPVTPEGISSAGQAKPPGLENPNLGVLNDPKPADQDEASPPVVDSLPPDTHSATSTETSADESMGSTTESKVLTPSGSEVAPAETREIRTVVVPRPAVAADEGFNALDLSTYGYWLAVPIAILTLVALGLFRWITGSSSANELERYRYRGPKLADPDAPDVRGRFRKRNAPRNVASPADDLDSLANESLMAADESSVGVVSTPVSAVAESASLEEDDFDFFDDEEDSPNLEVSPSVGTAPMLEPVSATNDETEVSFDDSEDEFDFSEDDDVVTPVGAQAESDATEFDLTHPESQVEDDEDLDFFDDDSDAGFDFEEDEELATQPVATAALGEATVEDAFEDTDEKSAIATTATTAAVAGAATAGGSWFSRLFKKKKNRKTGDAPAGDDASESLVAVALENTSDSLESEVAQPSLNVTTSDELEDEFSTVATITPDADDELDFLAAKASANDDDDDDFGMFDDDSDAGYDFDLAGDEPEVAAAIDATTTGSQAPSVQDDVIDKPVADIDSGPSDADMFAEPVETAAVSHDAIGEVDTLADSDPDSDSFTAMWDDDEELVVESGPNGADSSDAVVTEVAGDPACHAEGELDVQVEPLAMAALQDELPLLEDQFLDDLVQPESEATATPQADEQEADDSIGIAATGAAAAAGLVAVTTTESARLSELNARIAELESQNQEKDALIAKTQESLAAAEAEQKSHDSVADQIASIQEELDSVKTVEQHLRSELATAEEEKQNAIAVAEERQAEIEQAKTLVEEAEGAMADAQAKAEATQATADAALAEAEQAKAELAAKAESETDSGSLMGAAGGGLAAMAVASADEQPSNNAAADDDPFNLPPEKVKVMLKKLKTERKKRLKTKEHLQAAKAKHQEVTATLAKVNQELESLKQRVSGAELSSDELSLADSGEFPSLQSKLDSAEDELN